MPLCASSAVTVVVKNLLPGTSPEKIAGIALAVQEIVMDRVSRMVMASYVDYLLTKVKETQFEERRRYSRELHDRLAHQMTVVTQSLDLYWAYRESDAERAEKTCSAPRPGLGQGVAGSDARVRQRAQAFGDPSGPVSRIALGEPR